MHRIESLEPRIVLDGAGDNFQQGQVGFLFAPDTTEEYQRSMFSASNSARAGRDDISFFTMNDNDRFTRTSTDGDNLQQGDATTITWSIVPDGTFIPGYAGEPDAPSNLEAALNSIYGDRARWLQVFQDSFDRLSAVSGVNYVFEPNDDGAAWGNTVPPGVLGVRGDVRISGHTIDVGGGVLAYNFFPNGSDMVIDTEDMNGANSFFGNTSSNSIRFRNMLMHEAGHGLGIGHVESDNAKFLMEPSIDTSFDGPQFDDILAMHRGYGDFNELAGNDNVFNATSLGDLLNGQPIVVGGDPVNTTIGKNQVDFLSIDDDSDTDFYQFTLAAPSLLSASLDPLGPTYNEGPQFQPQSRFESRAQSDLSIEILDLDGSSILITANDTAIGQSESINSLLLPAAGTYFAKVTGAQNKAQLYRLRLESAPVNENAAVTITQSDGATNVSEAGETDSYTVVLDAVPSGDVTISIETDAQVLVNPPNSLTFTPTNWDTPQTVTVTAVDDDVVEGIHNGLITHSVSGADYVGVTADSVSVVITDNDFPNSAPTAVNDSGITLSGVPVHTNVVANDTDDDGVIDASTVSIINLPSNGFVTNNLDGTVTYTPFEGFAGSDIYSYKVQDNDGADSNVAFVSIDVQTPSSEQVLFQDSFEVLGDNWLQDDQGDWFLSRQRATDGLYSLEVDGRAKDATVEFANGVDISGYSSVILAFDWLIERGFDRGEYLSLDISGDGGETWTTDVLQLRGNESLENVWNPGYPLGESTRVNLADWLVSTDLKVRFRSTVSASREDANVDNVRIIGKTVGDLNTPPDAVDDNGNGFTTSEDVALNLPDLLANDSDPDLGDEIFIQGIDTTNTIGSVNPVGNNEYQYDPAGGYESLAVGESSTDSFQYTITDGRGGQDTATVTILVSGVNDSPVAVDDSGAGYQTGFETQFTTSNVLTNDSDPDTSDELVIDSINTDTILGSVTDNGNGTFDYSPAAGFSGTETFTYTIVDGNGGSDTASITIVVSERNENPVAVDDNDVTVTDVAVTTNVIANDTDSDGTIDASSVQIVGQPSSGLVTNHSNGTITYTPNQGFVGSDSYTYTVRDDDGSLSNVATVNIEVNAPGLGDILFEDSFEGNGDKWIQDSQGDWFLSRQRATDGIYSLEVDGRANDATVEFANGVDISGYSVVILSFDWLIERGFDRGEYLSLDISGDGGETWRTNVLQLRGNESLENVWNPGIRAGESTQVDLADWLGSPDLKVRFRALVSGSREDANVDNVRIVGFNAGLPGGGGGGQGFLTGGGGSGFSFSFMTNGSPSQQSGNMGFGSSSTGDNASSNFDQFFGAFGNPSNNGSSGDDWLNDDEFDGILDGMLTGGNLF